MAGRQSQWEYGGRTYEIVFGSDVVRDGVFLELTDWTGAEPKIILEAFWSDAIGTFTVYACCTDLPFVVLDHFVQEARRRCPRVVGISVGTDESTACQL
jgi:hypothetical protein